MTREISSKLSELSADLIEPALDAMIENQFLKDIPALGAAVKIAGIGKTISDRIFLAKIQRFLAALDPVLSPEAQRFSEELESGEADASRTAENLLLAIDLADDLKKAPIIAALFQAFLRGDVNKSEFRRMVAAVNAAVVEDLLELAAIGTKPIGTAEEHTTLIDALRHTGLTDTALNIVTHGVPDLEETITPLGRAFASAISSDHRATQGDSASSHNHSNTQ